MKKIRIGCGAGYAGDRIEPAVELAQKGQIQYLVFECLAERTIAIGQKQKQTNPNAGFNELLEARMRAVLPLCVQNKIKIITNMGSANPQAAGKAIQSIAQSLGLAGLKIAIVEGDDVYQSVVEQDLKLDDINKKVSESDKKIVSANAYLGCEALVDALKAGADIVITGRVADPSLFLSPMIYEFGWSLTDWDKLGKGTLIGHLLECAGQITGGYYADPGYKDVQGLARLGFPIAEISENGEAFITKVPESGGCVNVDTCKEQMLYEIHNPEYYITPDVVADFSKVTFKEIAKDQVAVTGATGREQTKTLKVSVGYLDGFIGEGEMSYAGPGAVDRGQLALDIVKERLSIIGVNADELRFDLIGVNSLHGSKLSQASKPYEVRVRVAGRFKSKSDASLIGNEVEALYTNGPAAGGGAYKSVKEIVAMDSTLIERTLVKPVISYLEV
ncbi:acyclic terpene utilization AtuA family protein [Gilliamella sp. Pas-s95]|uniref:acyclic terpene utilization AtuA family protein n=1 Tax=Gilliamella sp. Pas-s95 TaxID=2687317 RepID=UPI00132B9C1F|nr:acyclic terpene utilization AtuA family protein [Gilliamella sp. Pas-s95]MWN05012.1 acyclic terpene utilization AtuA family protein [Gilliamella sp. Pas-s95]